MIILDYNDKRPIYEQITEKYIHLILSGVYGADEKLPSVRSLAVDLSINPNTIQKAYSELERQGYIYSVKGRGNFVRNTGDLASQKKRKAMEDLREQMKECKDIGIPPAEILEVFRDIYPGNAFTDTAGDPTPVATRDPVSVTIADPASAKTPDLSHNFTVEYKRRIPSADEEVSYDRD